MQNKSFNELGLSSNVLKSIEDMGFENPSPIQEKIIPVVMEGHDVIGQAQTGTGKTMAFGAPVLSKIDRSAKGIQCLILAPTRELAIQVNDELKRGAKYAKLEIVPVYGGQSIDRQIRDVRRGAHVVVGTPGRVLDLIRRRVLDLTNIEFLILDEADEMLNMGFIDDIEEIIKNANDDRQTLLFSATMPKEIKKLAQNYMKADSKHVAVINKEMTVSTVSQYYYEVTNSNRLEVLSRIIDVEDPNAAIIFCKTKKGVDELVDSLQGRGYGVEGMHGDMNQNARLKTLGKFKHGKLRFLIATDVAARGIDVDGVTHVINYDLPQDTESYVHRIGRTGRANREGSAFTLITNRDMKSLRNIERVTKSKIAKKKVPTIDEIFKTKQKKIYSDIRENVGNENMEKFMPIINDLKAEHSLEDIAATLMTMLYSKELSFEYNADAPEKTSSENVRLFLSIGRRDRVTVKGILSFFDEKGSIRKNKIGDIDILDKFTFVDVSSDVLDTVMDECSGKKLEGRTVRIEVANKK